MKITHRGEYYESSDPQIDPDGFNELQKKKDNDQKNEDIDRTSRPFKGVLTNLLTSQKFEQLSFEVNGNYEKMKQALLQQCEVLKDIINGSVVGQVDYSQEQIKKYLEDVSSIENELNQINIKQKSHQKSIEKLQLIKNSEQQQQQEPQDFHISFICEQTLQQLEQRVQILQKAIGFDQLKQNNEVYFYKGIEFIGRNETINDKKEKNDFALINHTSSQYEADGLTIMGYLKQFETQISILNEDVEIIEKIGKIQQQDTGNAADQFRQQEKINNIMHKYGVQLKSMEDMGHLISRMSTLKELHNQNIDLPHQLSELENELDEMLVALEQSTKILDIIE